MDFDESFEPNLPSMANQLPEENMDINSKTCVPSEVFLPEHFVSSPSVVGDINFSLSTFSGTQLVERVFLSTQKAQYNSIHSFAAPKHAIFVVAHILEESEETDIVVQQNYDGFFWPVSNKPQFTLNKLKAPNFIRGRRLISSSSMPRYRVRLDLFRPTEVAWEVFCVLKSDYFTIVSHSKYMNNKRRGLTNKPPARYRRKPPSYLSSDSDEYERDESPSPYRVRTRR